MSASRAPYSHLAGKMAAFVKAVRISKSINNVTKLLTNLSLSFNNQTLAAPSSLCKIQRMVHPVASFHTTRRCSDLMEFFDDEKNWGENEIKVGRSWRIDELRLKSNEDLHKLWFVLLKERNMLFTMEEHCKREWVLFPNPERIDKVKDSMKNLEDVVRERNKAYHQLETGEDGERPIKYVYSPLGVKYRYRERQYSKPHFMNNKWHKEHTFGFGGHAVNKFRRFYHEKLFLEKRKARNREVNIVASIIRKFPNVDMEAIKTHYPSVDIDKVLRSKKARGHYLPK